MRKAPRFFIGVIVLIFVGWGGFWVIGSAATERLLSGWLDARRAEGWTASYDSLNTAGFPSRFDTTITNLTLADPNTGIAWSAPVFQNLSLSYRPTDVIAVFQGEQVFATRDARHTVNSERFRASASFAPSVELPILRSVVELDAATITSSKGWTAGVDHTQLSMRETPGRQGHVYDVDVLAEGITPDARFLRRVRTTGTGSRDMERVRASATIRFDAPWDRYAIERQRPQPREIELTRLKARWGALDLSMSGVLAVTRQGVPEGDVEITAKNWRDMIAVAEATGALPRALVGTVTRAGQMLAQMSGTPDTLEATLTFKNGRAFLGPIPLGPAPVIVLP